MSNDDKIKEAVKGKVNGTYKWSKDGKTLAVVGVAEDDFKTWKSLVSDVLGPNVEVIGAATEADLPSNIQFCNEKVTFSAKKDYFSSSETKDCCDVTNKMVFDELSEMIEIDRRKKTDTGIKRKIVKYLKEHGGSQSTIDRYKQQIAEIEGLSKKNHSEGPSVLEDKDMNKEVSNKIADEFMSEKAGQYEGAIAKLTDIANAQSKQIADLADKCKQYELAFSQVTDIIKANDAKNHSKETDAKAVENDKKVEDSKAKVEPKPEATSAESKPAKDDGKKETENHSFSVTSDVNSRYFQLKDMFSHND